MTKMTDADADEALGQLTYGAPTTTRERLTGSIRAHIAALTAERDEAAVRHAEEIEAWKDATGLECGGDPDGVTPKGLARFIAGLEQERDTLRERVKVLEERVRSMDTENRRLAREERRLAAIRQRAGDYSALIRTYAATVAKGPGEGTRKAAVQAVARYILGEDAPAPSENEQAPDVIAHVLGGDGCNPTSEMDGLRGEMAEKPEPTATATLGPLWNAHQEVMRNGVEPTTAEAFATARAGLTDAKRGATVAGERAAEHVERTLSLLERRMGEMAWALDPFRAMAEVLVRMRPDAPDDAVVRRTSISANSSHALTMGDCRRLAALTDAPPVFTLEEVEQVLRREELGPATARRVRGALTALRK
jgi:hypothetical protein